MNPYKTNESRGKPNIDYNKILKSGRHVIWQHEQHKPHYDEWAKGRTREPQKVKQFLLH